MYNVAGQKYYVGDITIRQNKALVRYLAKNADIVKMEYKENSLKILDLTTLFKKAEDSRLLEEFAAIALTPDGGKWKPSQLDDKSFLDGLQDLTEDEVKEIWSAFWIQKKKWIHSAISYITLLMKSAVGDILSNLSQK